MTQNLSGKVKFFNKEKGFGFIVPENGANDVFVHITALQDSGIEALMKDDVVEFVTKDGGNGKVQAENISIVN